VHINVQAGLMVALSNTLLITAFMASRGGELILLSFILTHSIQLHQMLSNTPRGDDLQTNLAICKVETPIRDSIRELVTWECKEHGVKS
jgi:hypothetical protein